MKTANTCPDVVYCGKCKYFYIYEGYMCSVHQCKYKPTRGYNHSYCWKVYADPGERNKDNNCPYFELKWWRKLIK